MLGTPGFVSLGFNSFHRHVLSDPCVQWQLFLGIYVGLQPLVYFRTAQCVMSMSIHQLSGKLEIHWSTMKDPTCRLHEICWTCNLKNKTQRAMKHSHTYMPLNIEAWFFSKMSCLVESVMPGFCRKCNTKWCDWCSQMCQLQPGMTAWEILMSDFSRRKKKRAQSTGKIWARWQEQDLQYSTTHTTQRILSWSKLYWTALSRMRSSDAWTIYLWCFCLTCDKL